MKIPWYLMAKGKGGGGYKTASGPIVSVSDAQAAPLRPLRIGIDPVQDLHGYDNPWPAGGGKNLAPVATWSGHSGVVADMTLNIPANTEITLSLVGTVDTGTAQYSLIFAFSDNTESAWISLSPSATRVSATRTYTKDVVGLKYYSNANGWSASQNVTLTATDFQIELGSSATSFAPYSNECPISGWSAVNVWRTGKNLVNKSSGSTSAANWWIGSATTVTEPDGSFVLQPGTYTFSVSEAQTGIYVRKNGAHVATAYNATKLSFTLTEATAVRLMLYKVDVTSTYWDTLDIQLELGSATPYSPYSGNQYTIQLGQTVYGGTLDVTNGVLTVDRAMVDMGMLTWNKGTTQSVSYGEYTHFIAAPTPAKAPNFNFISSCYKTAHTNRNSLNNGEMGVSNTNASGYKAFAVRNDAYADSTETEFATAMSGQTIVYELATPIEISLTPTQISTLQGQNNLWADSGDVTVEYLASGGANADLMKLAVAFMGKR